VYVPQHFEMSGAEVEDLLAGHGAGELVTYSADVGLLATLLPFAYEPAADGWGTLHGHVARNNEHWQHEAVGESLVLLRGPDSYISPSWYASKREHGRVVPTWNYVTAHIFGRLVIRDEVDYVRHVVGLLTAKHEGASEHPWAITDAPERFIDGQLRAIVGVELQITRVEAKAKLSQNRPPADVDGVVAGLRQRGDDAMAEAVTRGRDAGR
jgi:transcriptional regulator